MKTQPTAEEKRLKKNATQQAYRDRLKAQADAKSGCKATPKAAPASEPATSASKPEKLKLTPRAVPCPVCHVAAGEPCVSNSETFAGYHASRMLAAGKETKLVNGEQPSPEAKPAKAPKATSMPTNHPADDSNPSAAEIAFSNTAAAHREPSAKQPGIIASIIAHLEAADQPLVFAEILAHLVPLFPDRREGAMRNTIRGTFAKLTKENRLVVGKQEKSNVKLYSVEGAAPAPKARKAKAARQAAVAAGQPSLEF